MVTVRSLEDHEHRTSVERAISNSAVMGPVHLVTFESRDGRVLQSIELTPEQPDLLKELNILHPPKVRRVDLKG